MNFVSNLDLHTVRVMALITIFMTSTAMLFAWRTNRTVAGMALFSLGLVFLSLGSGIGFTASVTDSEIVMIAGMALRLAGMMMLGQSIRRFRGFPLWPASRLALFAGVAFGAYLYMVFADQNFGMRLGVLSSAMAILAMDAAGSMFRKVARGDRRTHWSTGLVFAFAALYLTLRAIANLTGGYRNSDFSPTPVEIVSTICACIVFIGCAFGMLLASNARLRGAAERSAHFDPLTTLPNRRLFEDRLLEAQQHAIESGRPMGVIYVDLDEFKEINDTRGHQAGDDLLRGITAAMTKVIRPDDCLARVGGDEFVVLVENMEHSELLIGLAQRLRAAIEAGSTASLGRPVGASFGTAIFPTDGASVQDVMREADSRMYDEKRRHRNASVAMRTRAS